MSKELELVTEFMKTFNHPVLGAPQIPSPERCTLRVDLIKEELQELEDAIEAGDISEIADALLDIVYVTLGASNEFGLNKKWDRLFAEVHRSNMSKLCLNQEEVDSTALHYEAKGEEVAYTVEIDGKIAVYRSDNKLLKSVNYSPADIQGILLND